MSVVSARAVMDAMDRNKYEVCPIGITKSGQWLTSGDPMLALTSGESTPPEVASGEEAGQRLTTLGGRELVPGTSDGHFPDVDVVFPVLHGPHGEDGTVQGLLELAGLPYVGAGVLGSALGLDKIAQKAVLMANELPVVDYCVLLRSDWRADEERALADIQRRFDFPVFIKPANMGSSVGVSKARDTDELQKALALASRYDRRILIEAAIDAREIECSVLGNDHPVASVPGEVVPSNEFYDYRAKYIDDDSELRIPAPIDEDLTHEIQSLAVRAFAAIDCAGMARADFFLCRETGRLFINELNTIPGFTAISMYPKLWAASGVPFSELIDRLIDLAMERQQDRIDSQSMYEPNRG